MKTQFKIFLTALMFYTRFPIKNINGWNEEMLNKSTRYFTLIGILVGAVGAAVFFAAIQLFPQQIAVALSIAATIFFTGAFHEDGFADFCDGFGGGSSPSKILEIMKDSRIGTYGSVGLILILGIKFLALSNFPASQIPLLLIAGHAASRMFPVLLIYSSQYVRIDLKSKVKPIGHADSIYSLLFALLVGATPLFFISWKIALIALTVLSVAFLVFQNYVNRKLGGYTGDVLGALQQLSELFFYLSVLAFQTI